MFVDVICFKLKPLPHVFNSSAELDAYLIKNKSLQRSICTHRMTWGHHDSSHAVVAVSVVVAGFDVGVVDDVVNVVRFKRRLKICQR